MANRLQFSKSPYLLQHANNPVDWFPWGEEAFAKAKQENKPIFLSIGYASCHWCHVMARESFANPQIAELLNQYFVSIKVDREERPDLDQIYILVCQALNGNSGWPLSIMLTPSKAAFWAGTYLPPEGRLGQTGFKEILTEIGQIWQKDNKELLHSAQQINLALKEYFNRSLAENWNKASSQIAFKHFQASFDPEYGGFGSAPKFPMVSVLSFLLAYYRHNSEPKALEMVEKTLQKMYAGGIYDQVGFGFARYSTDRQWLIPHFEKMLYDNAQLVSLYLEAYQITKNPLYAQAAEEILVYIQREMTSPEGAFYASQDADSEGQEGSYYLWSWAEIKEVLGEEKAQIWAKTYGATEKGNFAGKNIFTHLDWENNLEEERAKLLVSRQKRVKPATDDKILTSWNCLMITALAQAAQVLQKPQYYDQAVKALEFILANLVDSEVRLLARYREGEAAHLAYLDDYAFLIQALLELYAVNLAPNWRQKAILWQQEQDRLFSDKNGGYFFSGFDGEALPFRPKIIQDGAIPSGNSVTALNLLQLNKLTGNEDYLKQAKKLGQSFGQLLNQQPDSCPLLLKALDFFSGELL